MTSSTSPKTPVNDGSRPPSPGVEATEEVVVAQSQTVDKESIKLENTRRKSTSWKGKLTRQLSSAQLKLKNPFKEKKVPMMQSEPGTPIEHRDLNFPLCDNLTVPDASLMREALSEGATAVPSEGSSSATTLSPNMDANYLTKLEQEITTSLNKLGYKDETTIEDEIIDCDTDTNSNQSSDNEESTNKQITPIRRKRTTSQPTVKRVEFLDSHRISCDSPTRPTNLDLMGNNDMNEPIRPPRAKDIINKREAKRNERLFSVPNLKMSHSSAAPLKDLRSRSGKPESQSSSGFAANFVRRFSKYQLSALNLSLNQNLCLTIFLYKIELI